MDHSNAILLELANESVKDESIVSESSDHHEEFGSDRHEKMEHNKEQHQRSGYYNKPGDKIRNYSEVILFGPTDAKRELLNLLMCERCN